MSKVLVAGAILACSHGGRVRIPHGDDKLKIGGVGVLVLGSETDLSFLPATAPSTPDNPVPCPVTNPATGAPSPCSTTKPAMSGISVKLTVGGKPALLANASGRCLNPQDPSAGWSVADPGQSRCEAD